MLIDFFKVGVVRNNCSDRSCLKQWGPSLSYHISFDLDINFYGKLKISVIVLIETHTLIAFKMNWNTENNIKLLDGQMKGIIWNYLSTQYVRKCFELTAFAIFTLYISSNVKVVVEMLHVINSRNSERYKRNV